MRHWHHGRKESIFYENNRHKVFMTHSFGRQLCFCCLIFLSFGVFYFLSLVWRLFAHFSWYNFVLDTSYIPIQLVFPYSKPTNAVQGYPTNMRFFNVNINIQYIWIHIYIYTHISSSKTRSVPSAISYSTTFTALTGCPGGWRRALQLSTLVEHRLQGNDVTWWISGMVINVYTLWSNWQFYLNGIIYLLILVTYHYNPICNY